jgi:hypothetical protein
MGTNVIDLNAVRMAHAIAEEFEKKLGSEIKRAVRNGFKLTYKLEEEEQIGRGTINVARVRLLPESTNAVADLRLMGQAFIEARADYLDPGDVFDAIKAAVDAAFSLATDAGVFR